MVLILESYESFKGDKRISEENYVDFWETLKSIIVVLCWTGKPKMLSVDFRLHLARLGLLVATFCDLG